MSAPNKTYDPVRVAALAPAEVEQMTAKALAAVAAAADLAGLKDARLAHLGGKAPLIRASSEVGALPPAARAEAGQRIAAAKQLVTRAVTIRQAELEDARDRDVLVAQAADVSLPWDRRPAGYRHPVTMMAERLSDVFIQMGYEVAEGPEVEAEWYNFDALNFGKDHPAREMQDTFFVAGPVGAAGSGMVLRTHTSPVQIRAMLARPLPLYVVSPGKCFRSDALDATHSPVFHQIEGLAVDKGLTMAHLRGAISAFVSAVFGEGLRTRLRPDYFPFTEPSADVSMQCHVCRGASAEPGGDPCRVCKSQGWIEIAGCGMVNPRVLVACGIDPDVYTGFAFGLGIERPLMIRHGVTDIRDTLEGDLRFSRALGTEAW